MRSTQMARYTIIHTFAYVLWWIEHVHKLDCAIRSIYTMIIWKCVIKPDPYSRNISVITLCLLFLQTFFLVSTKCWYLSCQSIMNSHFFFNEVFKFNRLHTFIIFQIPSQLYWLCYDYFIESNVVSRLLLLPHHICAIICASGRIAWHICACVTRIKKFLREETELSRYIYQESFLEIIGLEQSLGIIARVSTSVLDSSQSRKLWKYKTIIVLLLFLTAINFRNYHMVRR